MNDRLQQAGDAYKTGDYKRAIELLSEIDDGTEEENWFASLFLGMSYVKADKAAEINPIMKGISTSCSNEQLRKAAAALLAWYQSTEVQTKKVPDSGSDDGQLAV